MSRFIQPPVLILCAMIVCISISQILLKLAGNYAAAQVDMLSAFLGNSWLLAGLFASAAGLVFWLLALRCLPLAVAYPWTALIYVITPVASSLLFNDFLSVKYVLGMTCIVAGVILTTGGVATK